MHTATFGMHEEECRDIEYLKNKFDSFSEDREILGTPPLTMNKQLVRIPQIFQHHAVY